MLVPCETDSSLSSFSAQTLVIFLANNKQVLKGKCEVDITNFPSSLYYHNRVVEDISKPNN